MTSISLERTGCERHDADNDNCGRARVVSFALQASTCRSSRWTHLLLGIACIALSVLPTVSAGAKYGDVIALAHDWPRDVGTKFQDAKPRDTTQIKRVPPTATVEAKYAPFQGSVVGLLPRRIGGYERIRVVPFTPAEISRFRKGPYPITDGCVAEYRNQNGASMELWVVNCTSVSVAEALIREQASNPRDHFVLEPKGVPQTGLRFDDAPRIRYTHGSLYVSLMAGSSVTVAKQLEALLPF